MFWSEFNWSTCIPYNLPQHIRFDLAVFQNVPRIKNLAFASDETCHYVRFEYRYTASANPHVSLDPVQSIGICYWSKGEFLTVHALYEDFPRKVPHLNETPVDEPCHLCLWAYGTTGDLYAHHGIAGVIRQLDRWLFDTDRGTSQKDGWDPTPRTSIFDSGHLIFDVGQLQRELYRKAKKTPVNQLGKASYYAATEEDDFVEGCFFYDSHKPFTKGKPIRAQLNATGVTKGKLDVHIMCATQAHALDTHQPLNLVNEENLRLFTDEIGLGEAWHHRVQKWKEAHHPFYCIVLIGQWRNQRLNARVPGISEDEAGCIEITPLLVQHDDSGALSFRSLKHITDLSLPLLANTSGTRQSGLKIAILGCGALGSVLADTLVRSGQPVSLVVDKDMLLPHNLARHVLGAHCIGYNKAEALADHLNMLGAGSTKVSFWPTDLLRITNDALRKHLEKFDLIIDATASRKVHQGLVAAGITKPVARCYMSGPNGDSGVMYINEPGRILHSDCHNQVIAQTQSEPVLRQWAQHSQKDNLSSVSIGLGCNSVSLTLPFTTIQSHASVMVTTLRKWFEEGNSKVMINTLNEGFPTGCHVAPVTPPDVHDVPTTNELPWSVRISDGVLVHISASRKPDVESGGYLLGGFDYRTREIHIGAYSTCEKGTATATRFALPPIEQDPEAQTLRKQSFGMLMPMGSWHTHLGTAYPSPVDLLQLDRLQSGINNDNRPFVMLISGTDNQFELRVSFPENWGFTQVIDQKEVLTC